MTFKLFDARKPNFTTKSYLKTSHSSFRNSAPYRRHRSWKKKTSCQSQKKATYLLQTLMKLYLKVDFAAATPSTSIPKMEAMLPSGRHAGTMKRFMQRWKLWAKRNRKTNLL